MISVTIYYDEEHRFKGFSVEGHAGMAEPGEYDLVCASVSALTQTALLGLDAYMNGKPQWEIKERGYLKCLLPAGLSGTETQQAEVIMHTMELGLKSIEEAYGKCLKVSKRRWTKCCSK